MVNCSVMKVRQQNLCISLVLALILLVASFLALHHDHDLESGGSFQEDCAVCLVLETVGEGAALLPPDWVILLALVVHCVLFKVITPPAESVFASYHTRAPPV
jgi:hypothetical protein